MKKKIIRKIPNNKFVKKYKKVAKEEIKMAKEKKVEEPKEKEEKKENPSVIVDHALIK